ncbi:MULTISPECIES: hypothetical protein [Streptomyces]|nr:MULTISPECIES: hypothetical protein [Streptomyces]
MLPQSLEELDEHTKVHDGNGPNDAPRVVFETPWRHWTGSTS